MRALRIAIVGSGPAAFYAAEAIQRRLPGAGIDMLERLAEPHGLVRFGVAPDHAGTKAVTRVFERIAAKPGFRLLTGQTLGREVGYAALKAQYDAVVLAFGAAEDRALGIPGEDLDGVLRSGALAAWFNGHPERRGWTPRLGRRVAIIGNGNVALDMARLLAKSAAELAAVALPEAVRATLAAAPIEAIHLIGRRGPAETRFTPKELGELAALARAAPLVEPADAPEGDGPCLALFRQFASERPAKPLSLRFHFHATPRVIRGRERLQELLLERAGGVTDTLAVDTIVTAIGYRCRAPEGVPMAGDVVRNDGGRVEPGVYVVGWARRGPCRTIPTNRSDAAEVVERLVADLAR